MTNALTGAPWLTAMARVFDNAGAELYIVGGAVRNPLMGLPLSDIDACGPARAEDVCALCEGTAVRARMRAADFGTVELYVTDENGEEHMAEYTAWREDSYLAGHRPDAVHFTTDIAVDAVRRDFSVNAMYQRVRADGLGDVIDPTGGLGHLKEGVLHTVTPDPDRVLGSDGQRLLRGARFQAELDLVPTDAMLESCRRCVHLLEDITSERMRDELQKVLMADLRYPTLHRRFPATYSGLGTIRRIGAWPYLFGDTAYDEEAAAALCCFAVPTLPARMALLMRRADPAQAAQTMQRMRFTAADADLTRVYVTAMQTLAAAPLPEAAKLGRDALETALAAFRALGDEAGAQAAESVLNRLQGKPMTLRELAITGNDLKPVFARQNRPMREMGTVLDSLWRAVLEGDVPNRREALMNHPILNGGTHQ